jgi:hypothetical protein
MTCQVVGNILGATVIEKVKQSTFFIGFTILALIAAAWMMGLPTPKPHPAGTKTIVVEEEDKPLSPKKGDIELQAYSAEDPAPAGPQLTKAQRQGSLYPQNPHKNTGKNAVQEMWGLIKTKRWLKFTPVIFFSGMSMAIYAALLIPMFSRTMSSTLTDARKTSLACQSMIGMGAGEILGSLTNGKLNDYCGVKAYLWICVSELTLAYVMLFWYNEVNDFDLASAVAVAFCWGLQDSGITNFFLCIAGFQFGGSTLPFSALRFVQALAIGSFALIESQVQTVEQHRIYFICTFCFALFAWMLFFFTFDLVNDKKDTKVSAEPTSVSAKPMEE